MVTPSHAVSVSFVAQVGVPATAGWSIDVTNRACVYPPGETYNVCVWSNQVVNTAYVGLDTGEVVLVPAGEFQMGCGLRFMV